MAGSSESSPESIYETVLLRDNEPLTNAEETIVP
jgi:hypothetical protein